MEKKKVLAIIPARGGSKRLPKKNIKLLDGKPLIAHTIDFAVKSTVINKVILSTESEEIANIALEFGAEIMMRPEELAQDTTKTAPVMMHVVDELEKQGYIPDIVILLQPTCPVREKNLAENVLNILEENNQFDSIFTAYKRGYTMALWTKSPDKKVTALYDYHLRPRWQDVDVNDELFVEDGGFYAIRYDAFKKYQDFIGGAPCIYEVAQTVDIDTENDFKTAELLMKG